MPLSLLFFFASIIGIFLSDIFVVTESVKLNLFLTILSPFFLFLLVKLEGKKILIPKKESFFYFLFILFSIISTFFAIDKEVAFESLLIYISFYFYFIFSFNYGESLKKYFKKFLVGISVFSCSIFFADQVFHLNLFQEGASLFYGGYYHNELGNLLLLGLIICLFDRLHILLLFFLPFFIFSYSRTAYLSLIVVSTLFLFIKKKLGNFNQKIILLNIILIGIILFFNTTKEINRFFPNPVKNILEKRLLLPKEKSLTGKRPQHYYYAWLTILEKPVFGVGPDNLYLSTLKKQFNQEEGTTTAHNLILDIFSENGGLAGVSFLIFLAYIFKRSKKDLYYYLFLALGLIFLFNFSYRYTSFFLIWIILAGIGLVDNKYIIKINKPMFFLPIITVFMLGQTILLGNFFNSTGLTDLSLKIYPLNKAVYREVIENHIRKNQAGKAVEYLMMYDLNFKDGFIADNNKGRFYEELKDKKKAIYFYEKAIYEKPTSLSILLNKIFNLNVSYYGNKAGRTEMDKFINQFKKDINIPKNSDIEKMINNFCYDNNLKCK